MNKIKFLGNYVKLHNQTRATLIKVNFVEVDKNTSKELLDYDTTREDGSKFNLKDGQYLQLIFIGNLGIPFSTLRSISYEKIKHYVLNLNKEFEIEIEEEK